MTKNLATARDTMSFIVNELGGARHIIHVPAPKRHTRAVLTTIYYMCGQPLKAMIGRHFAPLGRYVSSKTQGE